MDLGATFLPSASNQRYFDKGISEIAAGVEHLLAPSKLHVVGRSLLLPRSAKPPMESLHDIFVLQEGIELQNYHKK